MSTAWPRHPTFVSAVASAMLGFAWSSAASAQSTYQDDIDRWVAQDALDPHAAGSVLFFGSSSIQRWEALTRDFAANPDTLQPGETLRFDFGPNNPEDGDFTPSPDAFGNHWNTWHPKDGNTITNAGEFRANLVNTDGGATGIDLIITAGFNANGKLNGGLANPDPALLGELAITEATSTTSSAPPTTPPAAATTTWAAASCSTA